MIVLFIAYKFWFETGRYFGSAARIWKISDDISSMRGSLPSVCVLNDYNAKTDGQSGSITNLAWNVSYNFFRWIPYSLNFNKCSAIFHMNQVSSFHHLSKGRYSLN